MCTGSAFWQVPCVQTSKRKNERRQRGTRAGRVMTKRLLTGFDYQLRIIRALRKRPA